MTEFKEIKQLFGITEKNGFSEEEIFVFKNICENIPKVLSDYYSQLGKIKELNNTQDQLIEPQKLKLSKNKDFLIFYVENQWACVWGIDKNDLNIDNPPVYMSYEEQEWSKETNLLTDFLKAMANLQAVFALQFSSDEFAYINDEELKIIKENFKKRDFSFSQWIGIEFYGNFENDVIAVQRNTDYYDLIYASNNEEQFVEMNKILNKLGV
ncbi:hypothetical protein ASF10_23330 [Flavobacterium sp. Leaf82]|uniref:Knr4/Smi1-like domain-containing protein n=1 Tax=Flavobacterium reichenbachii TaxID=362418 RepID=A0A085ZFP9_9FLAO|nr:MULTISPECIES: hypothetical protein [Flavobacterium]KFF03263.1 hypothetical protein IW19_20405 [Flavobacterium reichenbachii]KQO27277.1 hypothetical protein ASF10_23330 [Flavobacterium sp. Leaf82]OXB15244.1 hypothetical protein B0A68_11015 [Flavobacterium reichenbachii]